MMIDTEAAEAAVRRFLSAYGVDCASDPVLDRTPRRVADAFAELFSGVGRDADEVLSASFPSDSRDLVSLNGIEFRSTCMHHLLPFYGSVDVTYLPGGRLTGFSTIARLVDLLASRPQIQEELTAQIADAMERGLGARGVIVAARAHHDCLGARGPRQQHVDVVTVAARGELSDQQLPTLARLRARGAGAAAEWGTTSESETER